MKSLVIIATGLLLAAPLAAHSAAASGAAPTLKKARPPAAAAPMRAQPLNIPEPSGMFGWLVLTDPATGERWYPTGEEGRARGAIGMTLQFRNVQSGAVRDVYVTGGPYFLEDRSRHAWRYAIRFNHDTTWEREPTQETASHSIKYSPNLWRFNGVSGPVRYRVYTPVEGGRTRVDWETVFERRGGPFADLPDILP